MKRHHYIVTIPASYHIGACVREDRIYTQTSLRAARDRVRQCVAGCVAVSKYPESPHGCYIAYRRNDTARHIQIRRVTITKAEGREL